MVGAIAAGLVLVFGLAAWTLLGREDASPPAPTRDRLAVKTEDPLAASAGESQIPSPHPEREVSVAAAIPATVQPPAPSAATNGAPQRATTGAPVVAERRSSAPPAQPVASVQAHPVKATPAQPLAIAATEPAIVTTIDPLLLPKTMDLEKITRAIDDSTRRKVEAATKRIEMKPPTFKEP